MPAATFNVVLVMALVLSGGKSAMLKSYYVQHEIHAGCFRAAYCEKLWFTDKQPSRDSPTNNKAMIHRPTTKPWFTEKQQSCDHWQTTQLWFTNKQQNCDSPTNNKAVIPTNNKADSQTNNKAAITDKQQSRDSQTNSKVLSFILKLIKPYSLISSHLVGSAYYILGVVMIVCTVIMKHTVVRACINNLFMFYWTAFYNGPHIAMFNLTWARFFLA